MKTKHGAGLRLSEKKLAAAAAAIRRSDIMSAARVMLREMKSPYRFSPSEVRLNDWLAKAEEIVGNVVDSVWAKRLEEAHD